MKKNQIESFNNDDMIIENINIHPYAYKIISILHNLDILHSDIFALFHCIKVFRYALY